MASQTLPLKQGGGVSCFCRICSMISIIVGASGAVLMASIIILSSSPDLKYAL